MTTGEEPFGLQLENNRLVWGDHGSTGPVAPVNRLSVLKLPMITSPNVYEFTGMEWFTISGDSVYFTDFQTDTMGLIRGASLLDGVPFASPLLLSGMFQPDAFFDDSKNLYWFHTLPGGFNISSIEMTAVNATTPSTVASPNSNADYFRVDTTYIYWIENTSVWRSEISNGIDKVLVADTEAETIKDLHIDESVLYWIRKIPGVDTHVLMTWDASIETPIELWSDPTGELRIMTTDATQCFWRTHDGNLYRIGKRGT